MTTRMSSSILGEGNWREDVSMCGATGELVLLSVVGGRLHRISRC